MKRVFVASIVLTLSGVVSLSAQAQPPSPYLSTFGAWTFCVNGMAKSLNIDCSWYTPGRETYSLNIPAQEHSMVAAYRYTVTAVLLDGSEKVLTGVAVKDALKGYTIIPGLEFGGVVKSAAIDIEDMYPGPRTKTQSTPVTLSLAMRR